jgi:hypothetical protein
MTSLLDRYLDRVLLIAGMSGALTRERRRIDAESDWLIGE